MLTWYPPRCSASAANGSSSPGEASCVNSQKGFPPYYMKNREANTVRKVKLILIITLHIITAQHRILTLIFFDR